MTLLKCALTLAMSALAVPAMACFTVYNSANQVVYTGDKPPIDMSYQIHERLPAAFPGGHMVFGDDVDCRSLDARRIAPQLTNVVATSTTPSGRRPVRMTQAQRQRQLDALTK